MAEGARPGWTGHLVFAVIAAGVGSGFQHGYNTGVLNAPINLIGNFILKVKRDRNAEASDAGKEMIYSIITSIFCVGGLIGALVSGIVGRVLGRKSSLIYNNILVFVAAALMGFAQTANSYEMLIVGRLIIGINCGLNAGLAPLYLEEISPVNLRGSVGTVYQLVITISIVISQLLGFEQILGTDSRWPYLFAVLLAGAVLMIVTLPFCPESPKYLLVIREQDAAARTALTWFRGTAEVESEMVEMKSEADRIKQEPTVTWKEMLSNPMFKQPLVIVVVIMLSQQLSGINAAIGYSQQIFESAGLSASGANYASVGMGIINVMMTVASLFLVERAGRRTLLLTGYAGMAVTTIVLSISQSLTEPVSFAPYISVAAVYLFVIMFATGLGSIPWFLVTEMFGMGAKDKAQPIAVSVNWGANILVTFCYLPLNRLMGPPIFLVFTILLVIFWCYSFKRLPETKGRTVEEVTKIFRRES